MILAACKDPGGLNVVLPVIKELRLRHREVTLVTNGKSVSDILFNNEESYTFSNSGDRIYALFGHDSDLLITSLCDGGIGRDLIPSLATVALQDFWGAWLSGIKKDDRPEYICVNDGLDANFVKEAWPDFTSNNIIITGYPSFDKYASVACEAVRRQVYAQLDLDSLIPMVMFAGQLEYTADALWELVLALNNLRQDVYLVPRFHPRMMSNPDWIKEKEKCMSALARFNSGISILDTQKFDSSTILAASDVVTGMFTTMLFEAAALRKPNVSILYPDSGMKFFKENCPNLSEFPLVDMGCTYKATKGDKLVELLSRALQHPNELKKNQEKHFQLDGRNTRRVANLVESLL